MTDRTSWPGLPDLQFLGVADNGLGATEALQLVPPPSPPPPPPPPHCLPALWAWLFTFCRRGFLQAGALWTAGRGGARTVDARGGAAGLDAGCSELVAAAGVLVSASLPQPT